MLVLVLVVVLVLESIQWICKRPTYRFEDTIVWERWHFWRSEINIDYTVWYSASDVFVHLRCPSSNLVYRSLESTLIVKHLSLVFSRSLSFVLFYYHVIYFLFAYISARVISRAHFRSDGTFPYRNVIYSACLSCG